MISDTLHDAVNEIDSYLNDDGAGFYSDPALRERILGVRDNMERLRCFLDTHPDGTVPPFRSFQPRPSIERATDRLAHDLDKIYDVLP